MRAKKGVLFWLALATCFASVEALAQSRADAAGREIIVTGERVPRTLLDTQSSVAVVTADAIAAQAAPDRVDQLLALIPNVQAGSGGEGPTIRGQDSTGALRDISAFFGGTRPRVTLQADGRAVGYYEYVFGVASVWDVEQVEVFRGPQTTTQGRNSIAGAIFVRTADPTYGWEGRARIIAGNLGTRQGSAVLSGPLVKDQLAFRVSGDIRRTRSSSDMFDAVVDADLDHDDFGVARIKLLAEPHALPGFRLETTYVHGESQAPQFEAIAAPFRERRNPNEERTNGVMRINADSLTAVASFAPAPGLKSRTTLSAGDGLIQRFGLPRLGRARTETRDFSVESVLDWQPQSALSILGGAYRLTSRMRQTIDVSGLGLGFGVFNDRQASLGLFGEATWRPAPALAVTGGLRYQRDRQDREGLLTPPRGPRRLDYDRTFAAWLPKVSLTYDFAEDLTAGVLVQRAFNPGGITIVQLTLEPDEFDKETLWNYEAFLRARFAGGRGTLAANMFYSDISGAQRQQRRMITPPIGPPLPSAELVNAPAAESYGAELALDWRASDRLSMQIAAGVLKTRILRTSRPDDASRGKEFQRSPRLSASAAIDWKPIAGWQLSAQVRGNSGYFSDDTENPLLRIEGSIVVNARAAYTRGGVTVFGYARNLFDAFYLTNLFSPVFGTKPVLATAGDPREVGVGIEARF